MPQPKVTRTLVLALFSILSLSLSVNAEDGSAIERKGADRATRPAWESQPHRFWDANNVALFAGILATRALDYGSTRHFRAQGIHEALLTDSIVDNKSLFIGIEAAGTAASVGVAYWLHRTAHHKLERWLSLVHIGVGTLGNVRNYNLGAQTPGSAVGPARAGALASNR
jgi:hypothetical protein